MDRHDFHHFREIVASLIGDDVDDKELLVNTVGSEISAEMADSIARLD